MGLSMAQLMQHAGGRTTPLALAMIVLAGAGCDAARRTVDGAAGEVGGGACTRCHGGAHDDTGAPPHGFGGDATTLPGVGAHSAHVTAGPFARAFACGECHPDPRSTPGSHLNGHVDVVFGALATASGRLTPAYDRAGTHACANVYCHGAFEGGRGGSGPVWTDVGTGQAACGTCHGIPPLAPHPPSSDCGRCHPGYTATAVNPVLHVNGAIDVAGLTCTSCHGDASRVSTPTSPQLAAAPPIDTRGNAAVTASGVGAHERHLEAGSITAGVACAECHAVPTSVLHADGVVEVRFGALATSGGVAPTWDGARCASTYCHGAFKNGAATNRPAWTAAAADACGTCHGLPPGGTHVQLTDCGRCHEGYTATSVNLATHLDGHVDVLPLTCTSCHGDPLRAQQANEDPLVAVAPPTTATGRPAGAHLAHVRAGGKMRPLACVVCHQGAVPGSLDGHPTGAAPAVVFGAAAEQPTGVAPVGPNANESVTWTTPPAGPSYDAASGTCSATYCHGGYAGTFTYLFFEPPLLTWPIAGAAGAPSWTDGAMTCNSCHGNPPKTGAVWHSGLHGLSTVDNACNVCHPDVDAGGTLISDPTRHVNGTVDVAPVFDSHCFGCH
jgi:predicted CxxxxCH...CXXCH cytochrome family protein